MSHDRECMYCGSSPCRCDRKGGRPSRGLNEVLFVRAPIDLIERLDERLARAREKAPGRRISRADIVREILYQEVGDEL